MTCIDSEFPFVLDYDQQDFQTRYPSLNQRNDNNFTVFRVNASSGEAPREASPIASPVLLETVTKQTYDCHGMISNRNCRLDLGLNSYNVKISHGTVSLASSNWTDDTFVKKIE